MARAGNNETAYGQVPGVLGLRRNGKVSLVSAGYRGTVSDIVGKLQRCAKLLGSR